jgi:hypothetical protein
MPTTKRTTSKSTYIVSAEQRERGSCVYLVLLATKLGVEALIAEAKAAYRPGPIRQRSTVAGRAAFAALRATKGLPTSAL